MTNGSVSTAIFRRLKLKPLSTTVRRRRNTEHVSCRKFVQTHSSRIFRPMCYKILVVTVVSSIGQNRKNRSLFNRQRYEWTPWIICLILTDCRRSAKFSFKLHRVTQCVVTCRKVIETVTAVAAASMQGGHLLQDGYNLVAVYNFCSYRSQNGSHW